MANIKELRGRIKSVANIAKITKAMEMVASMKLRKVQQRALAARPYAEEIRNLMGNLAEFVGEDAELPLFRRRPVETIGVLLITSDRGLCGAYNANVAAELHRFERAVRESTPGAALKFYVYGRKGYTYLGRRGYHVERFYADPPLDALDFRAARIVGKDLVDAFLAGVIDDVKVVFTQFVTAARFRPETAELLPVTSMVGEPVVGFGAARPATAPTLARCDYLLEPDPESIFNRIIPRYLEVSIFFAMLSSFAAEQASRRMAMKGATDAATRMGKELRRVYNRARQESITRELLDIVGGAEAVS